MSMLTLLYNKNKHNILNGDVFLDTIVSYDSIMSWVKRNDMAMIYMYM